MYLLILSFLRLAAYSITVINCFKQYYLQKNVRCIEDSQWLKEKEIVWRNRNVLQKLEPEHSITFHVFYEWLGDIKSVNSFKYQKLKYWILL